MLQAITTEQFESILVEKGIVFIDFWAQWCVPCKNFGLVYEQASKIYPEILFGKVDIETEHEVAEAFQIRSIPHLMVFKQGIAIYSEAGSVPLSTLKDLVEQALKVDVSGLKSQLEASE